MGRPVTPRPPSSPCRCPTSAYLCAHMDATVTSSLRVAARTRATRGEPHLIILPLTSISCRRLSSRDSAAAAEAVDTLLSFPWTFARNAGSWIRTGGVEVNAKKLLEH